MQRKKNIRLIISLAVLLVVTGLLFWSGDADRAFVVDKTLFRTEVTAVNKVTLESPSGTVTLTYNGSSWKVNENHATDPDMIDVLFATIQQAEPRKPVAAALSDSIAASLKQHGVKVSLYAGDQLQKTFYAGGNAQKNIAYFLLPDGVPYVTIIPGYRVYTAGIFELQEAGWKDKHVFGFNWRNFQSLEVQFPADRKFNFKVAMTKEFFGIEGIQADTSRLNTFLDHVSLLTVDQYSSETGVADSLLTLSPKMIVRVTDIAKREYELKIFAAREPGGMIYGLIGDSQVAFFDPQKIVPLIRPKEFFIRK
jgi:hypothetical protein